MLGDLNGARHPRKLDAAPPDAAVFHKLLDAERLVRAHAAVESAATTLDRAIRIATRAVVGGPGIGGAGGGCRRRRSFRHVLPSMCTLKAWVCALKGTPIRKKNL